MSELGARRWRDLDLDSGLVTVLGKGNKQRSVPVGSHARAALEAWRGETKAANDAPVFPGRGGAPISQLALQIRIRQQAQRQGMFQHVHPTMLRHTFPSHTIESTRDPPRVTAIPRHPPTPT